MIDLERYFARIAYTGPRTPTRATLDGILHAHVQAIPFENLDVLLGARIDLAPEALEDKLVVRRRGGYCFEQNALLLEVLEALGFQVQPISARVRWQRPRDYTPARTHLFLRVELDGSYLADAGVGALSLTGALRLELDTPQPTPHETRRIIREGGRLFHQALLGDAWHDVCEFTLEAMPPIDREVASWYTSAHPGSHFKSRLVVARALPDGGRLTIVNRELSVRDRAGHATHHLVADPDELVDLLAARFGLAFPPGTRFACPALEWS